MRSIRILTRVWTALAVLTCAAAILVAASPTPPPPASVTDPCAVILKKQYVFSAKAALKCLEQFKIDKATRIKQAQALKGYLNLYPYLHLLKSVNVDAIKELDEIANDDSIKAEIEFHARVSHLLILFRDPHAVYTSACFNNIVYRQPWSLEAVHLLDKPNERPRIFIRGPISDSLQGDLAPAFTKRYIEFYKAAADIDIRKYRGWEVIEINGNSAYSAIRYFSDQYSRIARDPNSRFNAALARHRYNRQGQLVLEDGDFVLTTDFPWEWETEKTYKLWNPKTNVTKVLTVPWMGQWYQADVLSSKQYYKDFCTVGGKQVTVERSLTPEQIYEVNGHADDEAPAVEAAERATFDPDSDLDVKGSKLHLRVESTDDGTKDDDSKWGEQPATKLVRRDDDSILENLENTTAPDEEDKRRNSIDYWQTAPEWPCQVRHQVKPVYFAPYVSSYVIAGGKVGVFKLQTFSFNHKFEDAAKVYFPQVLQALTTLRDYKVQKVILDFSGNGGGFMRFGVILLKLLFNDARYPRFDIRLSKEQYFLLTVGKNIKDNLFNFGGNATRTLGARDPNAVFDKKNINIITRGGVREPYSAPFEFNPLEIPKIFNHTWKAKDFAVLSDGTCGSTCGLLSRALRNSAKVNHYVYGGFTRKPFQPSAFEAGNVISLNKLIAGTAEVLQYARTKRIAPPQDALFPQPFPLPVEDSQMLMWESYSSHGGNVSTPDEYIYTPADYYIQVERPAEIVTVWEKLAEKLVKYGDQIPPPATSRVAEETSEKVDGVFSDRWGV
ncbi:hypothetical protein HDU96_001736 [Phlyctochytrium bullatum]|nr:hypothetical protein HDU96_001736 [Phlyctochytrium bullatum]